jgi:hypothetical protein
MSVKRRCCAASSHASMLCHGNLIESSTLSLKKMPLKPERQQHLREEHSYRHSHIWAPANRPL